MTDRNPSHTHYRARAARSTVRAFLAQARAVTLDPCLLAEERAAQVWHAVVLAGRYRGLAQEYDAMAVAS